MTTNIRRGISWIIFALIALSISLCAAQEATIPPAPAPVPSQIIVARKVFISNAGGEELDSKAFFLPTFDSNQAYDRFYAALKNENRYELVPAPSDADLILEIRFGYVLIPNGSQVGNSGGPHLHLALLDPKTHILLWAFSERVETPGGPHYKDKRQKAFDQALTALLADLAKLASLPASPSSGSTR